MDYLIYNKETDELVDAIQLKDEKEKQNYEDKNPDQYLEIPTVIDLGFSTYEEDPYE